VVTNPAVREISIEGLRTIRELAVGAVPDALRRLVGTTTALTATGDRSGAAK
jgi:hypothetical protein